MNRRKRLQNRVGLSREAKIVRGKPLAPGSQLARSGWLRSRVPVPRTPPDNTPAPSRPQRLPPGFPRPVRLTVLRRDGGCFLRALGGCWGQVQAHHRQPVGAGGTSDPGKHVPSNGLGLCETHHGWVHDHPRLARPLGLLVRRSQDWHPFGVSPDNGRTWWLLADDGTRRRVPIPAANTEEYEVAA